MCRYAPGWIWAWLVLGVWLLLSAGGAAQEVAPEQKPQDPAPVPVQAAPLERVDTAGPEPIVLDVGVRVVDVTGHFVPVEMKTFMPDFDEAPPATSETETQEEPGPLKVRPLGQEGDDKAEEQSRWYGISFRNPSQEPIEKLLAFSHDELRRSGFGLAGSAPFDVLNIVFDKVVVTRSIVGDSGLRTQTWLTFVVLPGQTAKMAFKLAQPPQSTAYYVWDVEAYTRYVKYVTLWQGILLGALAILGALLIALWVFAGQRALLYGGLASLAAMAYLMLVFGYVNVPWSEWRGLRFSFVGAALAGTAALGNRFVAHLYRDGTAGDGFERALDLSFVLAVFACVYNLIGFPWALAVARIALVAVLAAACLALVRYVRTSEPEGKLVLPGWFVLGAAYVGAVFLSFWSGSTANLAMEWAVYGAFVFGFLLIGLSVVAQAGIGPFRALSPPAPVAGEAPSSPPVVCEAASPAPAPSWEAASGTEREPSPLLPGDAEGMRYELALSAAGCALWEWSVEEGRFYVSPHFGQRLGLEDARSLATEEAWLERLHPEDRSSYQSCMQSYLALDGAAFSLDFRLRHENGDYVHLELKGTCQHDERGRPLRCIGLLSDYVKPLHGEAAPAPPSEDILAALPRREAFLDKVAKALAGCASDEPPYAIILLDVDRFKNFDEGLGQANADKLLQTLAERLVFAAGSGDDVGRLGGDEFAVLFRAFDDGTTLEDKAAYVKDLVEHPVTIAGQEVFPTVSIGIAVATSSEDTALDLLERAEFALYEAKKNGGRQIVSFVPGMERDSSQLLNLESDLRRALDQYEMEVYYQPIMNLKSGQIAGFEALLRWNHPSRGLLGPDEFVSIAEQLGLIVRLGRFALSMTSLQLSQWQQFFPLDKPLFASVNVSAKQLLGDELVSDVRQIMQSVNIRPESLKLEVTENLLIENEEEAARILKALKELGAGLVLDDFGTGHSTMERLKRFPFDTIKIDQSFVSNLDTDEQALIMVQSAIDLAHKLNIDVVAEGVESETVGRTLSELGCTYAQGYVFGAPMTAMEAQAFIAHDWSE